MGILQRAKESFMRDTQKEREGLKEAYKKYKERREYNKRPEVIKAKIVEEQKKMAIRKDKEQLNALRFQNSVVGQVAEKLKSIKKNAPKTKKRKISGKAPRIIGADTNNGKRISVFDAPTGRRNDTMTDSNKGIWNNQSKKKTKSIWD